MFAAFNELQRLEITLYTDALITHGLVRTRQHRVTDILNLAEDPFLILEDVSVEEFGQRGEVIEAAFAQINLDAVLFAVATTPVEPVPELRTPKVQEEAIISIPPFRVTGTMHLLPSEGNLRAALSELQGRFLPITEATFWSDRVGEPRQQAVLVAVNHRRAQILAPHKVRDPWADVDDPGRLAAEAPSPMPTWVRLRTRRRSTRGGWSRRDRRRADQPAQAGLLRSASVPRSAASAREPSSATCWNPSRIRSKSPVVAEGSLPSVASSQFLHDLLGRIVDAGVLVGGSRRGIGHVSLLVVRGASMAAPCSQARARTGSAGLRVCRDPVPSRRRPLPSLPMDRRAFQAERSDDSWTAGRSNWR